MAVKGAQVNRSNRSNRWNRSNRQNNIGINMHFRDGILCARNILQRGKYDNVRTFFYQHICR